MLSREDVTKQRSFTALSLHSISYKFQRIVEADLFTSFECLLVLQRVNFFRLRREEQATSSALVSPSFSLAFPVFSYAIVSFISYTSSHFISFYSSSFSISSSSSSVCPSSSLPLTFSVILRLLPRLLPFIIIITIKVSFF